MKLKGNLIFLIGVVFVMLVFMSMTMTGCAVHQPMTQQRTTHEDKSQPPQPGQPPQPANKK